MEISMVSGPYALVSLERLSLSVKVENRFGRQVVFESASLTTLGRTYTEAFTTKRVAPLEWTVLPGGKQSIWFFFELDQPVVRAVGPTADSGSSIAVAGVRCGGSPSGCRRSGSGHGLADAECPRGSVLLRRPSSDRDRILSRWALALVAGAERQDGLGPSAGRKGWHHQEKLPVHRRVLGAC